MVPFNIESMRSWYVYIVRVTPTYVYVTSARNGEAYTPKGSVQDTYKGRTVSKIRIHGSVHKDFMGAYLSTHFDTPRLAALNMYERTVLSVELQPYSLRQDGFTSAENWQSGFSRNIQQIAQKLEGSNVTEAFINGAQIIWLEQADLMNRAVSSEKLAKEPNFKLVPVRFININQLSASRAMKATEKYLRRKEATGEKAVMNTAEKMSALMSGLATVSDKPGYCMQYFPDAESKDVYAYSPAFLQESDGTEAGDREYLWNIYTMLTEQSNVYVNLEFVFTACKTIGRLYGFEATDFFNVPEILATLGEVNITSIAQESRKNYPVSLDARSCLAFILGYIYREKNLNKQRDLNRMLMAAIRDGFIRQSSMENLYKEGVSPSDVPAVRVA